MRRLIAFLAVVLLFVLASAGQAADLQTGWYASFWGAEVWYGSDIRYDNASIDFPVALGNYGPLRAESYTQWPFMKIIVPTDAPGVVSGTGVTIQGTKPQAKPITRISFSYLTDYNPNKMRLELVTMDANLSVTSVLWSQDKSGYQSSTWITPAWNLDDGWVHADEWLGVRVVAVPEPPTWLGMLIPAIGLLFRRKR